MTKLKEPSVALLVDLVASRSADRRAFHVAVLAAANDTNKRVPALDPLDVTVGDELQGVYRSLGDALAASFTLRLALAPDWDARFGIGGGTVELIDERRNIQDGSAWWGAREAIDWVEAEARRKGYGSARTAVRDSRPGAIAQVDPLVRLVDAQIAGLRGGAVATLRGLWEGLENAAIAQREGISESANSQRVINNALRPLIDAMRALATLR